MASRTLILDNGSFALKAGYLGDDRPQNVPNFMFTRNGNLISGLEAMNPRFESFDIIIDSPYDNGFIESSSLQMEILEHVFSKRCLAVDAADTNLVMTDLSMGVSSYKSAMGELMFEHFGFPSLLMSTAPTLVGRHMYKSNGAPHCVVVDIGHSVTQVVPFLMGGIAREPVFSHVGGLHIGHWLRDHVSMRQIDLSSEPWVVHQMKEDSCFFAEDFMAAHNASEDGSVYGIDYYLPDRQHLFRGRVGLPPELQEHDKYFSKVHLNRERFCMPELIFQPNLKDIDSRGLTDAIRYVTHSSMPFDIVGCHLQENIVVYGGCANFPNLRRRIARDIRSSFDAPNTLEQVEDCIHVLDTPEEAPWRAASWLMQNDDDFVSWAVTKREYDEYGREAIYRHKKESFAPAPVIEALLEGFVEASETDAVHHRQLVDRALNVVGADAEHGDKQAGRSPSKMEGDEIEADADLDCYVCDAPNGLSYLCHPNQIKAMTNADWQRLIDEKEQELHPTVVRQLRAICWTPAYKSTLIDVMTGGTTASDLVAIASSADDGGEGTARVREFFQNFSADPKDESDEAVFQGFQAWLNDATASQLVTLTRFLVDDSYEPTDDPTPGTCSLDEVTQNLKNLSCGNRTTTEHPRLWTDFDDFVSRVVAYRLALRRQMARNKEHPEENPMADGSFAPKTQWKQAVLTLKAASKILKPVSDDKNTEARDEVVRQLTEAVSNLELVTEVEVEEDSLRAQNGDLEEFAAAALKCLSWPWAAVAKFWTPAQWRELRHVCLMGPAERGSTAEYQNSRGPDDSKVVFVFTDSESTITVPRHDVPSCFLEAVFSDDDGDDHEEVVIHCLFIRLCYSSTRIDPILPFPEGIDADRPGITVLHYSLPRVLHFLGETVDGADDATLSTGILAPFLAAEAEKLGRTVPREEFAPLAVARESPELVFEEFEHDRYEIQFEDPTLPPSSASDVKSSLKKPSSQTKKRKSISFGGVEGSKLDVVDEADVQDATMDSVPEFEISESPDSRAPSSVLEAVPVPASSADAPLPKRPRVAINVESEESNDATESPTEASESPPISDGTEFDVPLTAPQIRGRGRGRGRGMAVYAVPIGAPGRGRGRGRSRGSRSRGISVDRGEARGRVRGRGRGRPRTNSRDLI